jgi:hypothetical protein
MGQHVHDMMKRGFFFIIITTLCQVANHKLISCFIILPTPFGTIKDFFVVYKSGHA